MNEYIQKIASRSSPLMQADNSARNLVVPTKPEITIDDYDLSGTKNNDTIPSVFSGKEESRLNSGVQKEPPEPPGNLPESFSPITQVVNPIQPTRDELPPVTKVVNTTKEIFQPIIHSSPVKDETPQAAPTIIERIQQRSIQQTTIIQEPSEVKFISERIQPAVNDVENSIAVTEKKRVEQNQAVPDYKQALPVPTITHLIQPEVKQAPNEKLMPVMNQDVLPAVPNKTEQVNKLIIGKITVEVVNPVQPVKQKEVVYRTSSETKSRTPEFNSNNKLSFGLGQL